MKPSRRVYFRRLALALSIALICGLGLLGRNRAAQSEYMSLRSARFTPNPTDKGNTTYPFVEAHSNSVQLKKQFNKK
jgi:hypothetical protein